MNREVKPAALAGFFETELNIAFMHQK